eukprot:SAG11_NODE_473_length_9186_cov_2.540332_1_plen_322_part_00
MPPPFEFEPARLDTERGLGGVTDLDILPALVGLQRSNHILHARGGTLAELPAERMELPLDPCGHTQRLGLFVAPDAERTIYASQCSVLSRSRDGGKTWWHTYREPVAAPAVPDNHFMHMRVLPDGMWIRVVTGEENGAERPTSLAPPRGQAVLTVSSDEGERSLNSTAVIVAGWPAGLPGLRVCLVAAAASRDAGFHPRHELCRPFRLVRAAACRVLVDRAGLYRWRGDLAWQLGTPHWFYRGRCLDSLCCCRRWLHQIRWRLHRAANGAVQERRRRLQLQCADVHWAVGTRDQLDRVFTESPLRHNPLPATDTRPGGARR